MQKRQFDRLPLGAIRPGGWMLRQCQRDLEDGFTGALDTLTSHVAHDLYRDRIGTAKDQFAWWDSESRGNWLRGYLMMAALAGDDAHMQRALALVDALLATQDADGYLGIYVPTARFRHPPGENGELWAQSRALLVLLTAYEVTGDERYLHAVVASVAQTMSMYGPESPYFSPPFAEGGYYTNHAGLTHGLCFIDVVAWLDEIRPDQRYRTFGRWLYEDFTAMPRWFIPDDLRLKDLHHAFLPWGGHAVHTAEHLRALHWVALVTQDADVLTLRDRARAKLQTYCTPSGALIGDEQIHGRPLPESGYECCTLTEQSASLIAMLLDNSDVNLGDWIESLLFNAGQGARTPDGRAISYLSQDTRLFARSTLAEIELDGSGGERMIFSPTHEHVAVCCNPNMGRLLPQYIQSMWAKLPDEQGVACLLYGPATMTTQIGDVPLSIQSETTYPSATAITFTITLAKPCRFRMSLRYPAWATGHRIVGPQGMDVRREGDLLQLDHTWESGDVIHLSWETAPRYSVAANGEYAVSYGPLQYVLPIESERVPIRSYTDEQFADFGLEPRSIAEAYRIPILPDDPSVWLYEEGEADHDQPWDHPVCWLQWNDIRLVPMGSTLLRRSTFPIERMKR